MTEVPGQSPALWYRLAAENRLERNAERRSQLRQGELGGVAGLPVRWLVVAVTAQRDSAGPAAGS
jgi:hypothetical protein